MTLDILISQYKETEQDIKPMLDSIAIQQGIDFNDIHVIIANDGSDIILDDDFLYAYRRTYNLTYYRKPHGGMSNTRNYLLDRSTADYIIFCDADDMFFNVTALNTIFSIITQNKFDCLFPYFIQESVPNNGEQVFYPFYGCQVHGKVIRRQYLLEQNIRWKDELITHDSRYFFALCEYCTSQDRICYFNQPYYLWKYNKKSVTHSQINPFLDTYDYLTYSVVALVEELLKRDMLTHAVNSAISFIYLTYFLYSSELWQNEKNKELVDYALRKFKIFYDKYSNLLELGDRINLSEVIKTTRDSVMNAQSTPFTEKISFDEWKKQLQQINIDDNETILSK